MESSTTFKHLPRRRMPYNQSAPTTGSRRESPYGSQTKKHLPTRGPGVVKQVALQLGLLARPPLATPSFLPTEPSLLYPIPAVPTSKGSRMTTPTYPFEPYKPMALRRPSPQPKHHSHLPVSRFHRSQESVTLLRFP